MRLTFTPRCTTGATDSAIERPWERSPDSKSDTVVPSATVPARVRAPLRTSRVSRRVVLPPELGPTSTTLRISSGLRASRSCLPAARAPLSAMGTRCSCSGRHLNPWHGEIHSQWPCGGGEPTSSSVTEEQTVEGGLAEPEELEPDQGSLDLAAPEDRHDRAEWEAAAAAVLRKARRLTDDDPDAQVWDKLTRTTLDGIGITPLGTPDLARGARHGGPPGQTGAVGHPRAPRCHGRQDGQRDAAHRPGGRGHVAVARGRRGHRLERPARPGAARPRAGGPADDRGRCPGLPAVRRRPRAEPAHQPGPGRPARHPGPGRSGMADGRARLRGRRDRGPRPRRVRRPGARPLARRRCALPAHPDRRRVRSRRGRQDRRVPVRRDRRAVHDDRQAARGASALGPGPRAQRDQRPRAAPARRDQPTDDEQVRPLGEHAPHHRRRVRGRRGRRGRRHRAALRQPARRARRVRPPDRPQHLAPAHRRVARRHRRRPGRRCLRRREAHRRPRRRCLGAVRPARGRPGPGRRDRADRRAARPRDRDPQATADRAHRVPEPRRDAPRAGARAREPRGTPLRRGLRGAARRPARRPRVPGDHGHGRRAHRARDVRREPPRRRWHRRRRGRPHRDRRRPGRGVRRAAGRLPRGQRRRLRRVGRRGREQRCARPVRSGWSSPARSATPSTTPRPWASTPSSS